MLHSLRLGAVPFPLLESLWRQAEVDVLRTDDRRNLMRFCERDAGLPRQHVRKIGVIPALDRGRNGPMLGVKAVDRDDPALRVDENLDGPD